MLIGISRVRDEALIIADTLRHYLRLCDRILIYDDASTDDTADIADGFDRVTVTRGNEWCLDRTAEETRHRHILLEQARSMGAEWCLCFDADERLVGELPGLTADGYRFRLFDGYLTEDRQALYRGGDLAELPRMWGPEYRDILVLFKTSLATYSGLDRREPIFKAATAHSGAFIKHFGKCLSAEHWSETCHYYATYWPEPYKSKWAARRGKAVHVQSDFGRRLFTWERLMNSQSEWVKL